jgi:DinB superfamily
MVKGRGNVPHPLVVQLRFTRSEFKRALEGLGDADARRRCLPMNCISWNLGHLAWQEQRYWLWRGQDRILLPHVNELFAYGAPASTPPLDESWAAWHAITQAADPWLDTLTTRDLLEPRQAVIDGETIEFTVGTLLERVLYHYWYHTGENMAIRQLLGHTDLPDFVGNIDDEAPYVPH